MTIYTHESLAQKLMCYISWSSPDAYGTEPIAPENEAYIRTIIQEMNITKPIHIRKMNRYALCIFGVRNAFALHGNYLFISEQFLAELSDSEKRFLIAHELAHLLCNHNYKRIVCFRMVQIAALCSSGGAAIGISNRYNCNGFKKVIGLNFFCLFNGIGALVIKKCYRQHEYEADYIAACHNNNQEGGFAFLERLKKITKYDYSNWFNRVNATHPSPEERTEQLKNKLPKDTTNE